MELSPSVIPGLRELQGQVGLLDQFGGDADPLIGGVRVQPCGVHIANDPIAKIAGVLSGGLARYSASFAWEL